MFLTVKKMPKLFRFIAADFASLDAPIEEESEFNQKNRSNCILLKTIMIII